MSPDLADFSLLELFAQELQTNQQAIEAGLVGLEADQTPERLEPLMRAAHSIKGAARIVDLPQAVGLAHAMEDVFQAAQHGLRLGPAHVDALLAANDFFAHLSTQAPDAMPAALAEGAGRAADLESGLRAAVATGAAPDMAAAPSGQSDMAAPASSQPASGQPASGQPAFGQPESAHPAPAPPPPFQTGQPHPDTRQDGVVRLSADALGRLTGLAGQALVEAGLLGKSMERLRAGQSNLADCADILSSVRAALPDGGLKDELGRAQLLLKEAMTGHSKGVCALNSLSRRIESHAERLYRNVLGSRMRPFGEGARPLPRLVRDTGRELGRQAVFALEGASTSVDRDILERLEAPLMHLARNAVDHGLEPPQERLAAGKPEQGLVTLSARHLAGTLEVRLSDDGRGIDLERLRAAVVERALADPDMAARMTDQELLDFLFLPGFTTTHNLTHVSGRGVGLDVVKTMTQQVGGSVRVESAPGRGTTFILRLPVSRSVIRALVVRVNQEPYALPLARIGRVALPADQELVTVGGQRFLALDDGGNVGIAPAALILGMTPTPPDPEGVPVVVLESDGVRFGLEVDALLGERDLVVHPLDHRLGKIPGVAAASVLDDGMPVLILDEADLLRSLTALLAEGRSTLLAPGAHSAQERTTRRVLVVDDSLTVREVERQLLSGRGYDVVTAVDGMEGLALARMGGFDLVVTDVDMPRMTGIELTRRIKADPALARTPVMIVSYKDRQEDRMAGLQAGADYYLPKSGFKDEALLQAVFDLIGEP